MPDAQTPPHDELLPGQRPADRRRSWAPWRMQYVGGNRHDGCVFCHYLADDHDRDNLVLWRAERAFAIMNLFPYGTGHIMLVPNTHAASPETCPPAYLQGMTQLLPGAMRALRRALTCTGFNIGMNVGASAGAGIAEHLHQHVVPRWDGDSNFMPVLAGVQVLPELLPATYAKLRAEIGREMTGAVEHPCVARIIAVTTDGRMLVADATDGRQRSPQVDVPAERACWTAALQALKRVARSVTLTGWSGGERVEPGEVPAFGCLVEPATETRSDESRWRFMPIADLRLDADDRAAVGRARSLAGLDASLA